MTGHTVLFWLVTFPHDDHSDWCQDWESGKRVILTQKRSLFSKSGHGPPGGSWSSASDQHRCSSIESALWARPYGRLAADTVSLSKATGSNLNDNTDSLLGDGPAGWRIPMGSAPTGTSQKWTSGFSAVCSASPLCVLYLNFPLI